MEEIIEEIINIINSSDNDYDLKDHLEKLLKNCNITKIPN